MDRRYARVAKPFPPFNPMPGEPSVPLRAERRGVSVESVVSNGGATISPVPIWTLRRGINRAEETISHLKCWQTSIKPKWNRQAQRAVLEGALLCSVVALLAHRTLCMAILVTSRNQVSSRALPVDRRPDAQLSLDYGTRVCCGLWKGGQTFRPRQHRVPSLTPSLKRRARPRHRFRDLRSATIACGCDS